LVPKEIKVAKKETDKCTLCEQGKVLKHKIDQLEQVVDQNIQSQNVLLNLKKEQKFITNHINRKNKQKTIKIILQVKMFYL